MHWRALILLWLFAFSCASVMNEADMRVAIHSTEPATVVVQSDTICRAKDQVLLSVVRSAQPLRVELLTDSVNKTITLPSRNSGAYYLNAFYTLGIGLWTERDDPRRWAYPRRVYVDLSNTEEQWFRYRPRPIEPQWRLVLSLPYLNQFYIQPQLESDTKSRLGFLGIGVGVDYVYRSGRSWRLKASTAIDFPIFFPAPIDYTSQYQTAGTGWLGVTHQHLTRRWSWGYGLAYGRITWALRNAGALEPDEEPPHEPVIRRSQVMGFEFPLHYHFGDHFQLGILYRPTIWQLTPVSCFRYDHLLSIELQWFIGVWKIRR